MEAGASFVVVSGAWGYFDHHGDDVRWGGIEKGLKPLMPRVDRVFHALIQDLENRGMADSTLVYIMGEFGRAPTINKNAGRDHWTNCMSMLAYGGDLPKGKVIGATDARATASRKTPLPLPTSPPRYSRISTSTAKPIGSTRPADPGRLSQVTTAP